MRKDLGGSMNTHSAPFQPVSAQDLAWLGTDPIPAKPYYDPAYFELERQAIFMRTWLTGSRPSHPRYKSQKRLYR